MIASAQSIAFSFVRYALEIGAIELFPEGIQLKSGRVSPYFFNSASFNDGISLRTLAHACAETIRQNDIAFNALYGPPYKGIMLALPVAMHLAPTLNVSYTSSRKETKQHAEGGLLLGSPLEGKRVLIIDDVITTAATKQRARQFILDHGGIPAGLIIAFDREETAGEDSLSAAQQYAKMFAEPVYAVAGLRDLTTVLREDETVPEKKRRMLTMILEYKEQYGIS